MPKTKKRLMSETKKRLGFLDLPAEIRNMVYENLLLVESVCTQTVNPAFDDEPYTSPPYSAVGDHSTLQGVSIWDVEYKLETAILAVNRQVHDEASIVLNEENVWASITVKDATFPAQLKKAGFKILAAGRANIIKNPALKVRLSFQPFRSTRDSSSKVNVTMSGMAGECLSNIALARLELGDVDGASDKIGQAFDHRMSDYSSFIAPLRNAMVCADRVKTSFFEHLKTVMKRWPSDPQLERTNWQIWRGAGCLRIAPKRRGTRVRPHPHWIASQRRRAPSDGFRC